ncbi:O-linked N-acetylglucosamine transferase, SPINDLY family protein [Lichenicoccus roseus]|uniref:protein O-GlcNAc transferase n=1 Tax=Lichenicoccus roseus TaxID=2683649 RepID=A0A5R9IZR1_9PROT|nr:glycosyl transferase [Lichenicoccus roseus]TLU70954.1 glycosyl transferase [Lichenicoccus roseus]
MPHSVARVVPVGPEDAGYRLVELIGAVEALVNRNLPQNTSPTDTDAKAQGAALYAVWLQHHPLDPLRHAACFNFGVLLTQLGRHAEAGACFAEAISLRPGFLSAYVNHGLALERLNDLPAAVGQWLHVADLLAATDGDLIVHKTTSLKHAARVFKSIGDLGSAEEALRRCLDLDPHQCDAMQHWVALREMQCKWPVLAPSGRVTAGRLSASLSPLALAIHADDPMFQLSNAWRSMRRDGGWPSGPCTVGTWPPPLPAGRDPAAPLRIGYVSPDLREHAIGFLTVELFELHDPTGVEVFAYYSGRAAPDALQARFRRAVPHWCSISGWTDRQVASRIAHDGIDILVDLGGHTGDVPGAALALRPAPVMVNWLGYPGSMGTPHHQYIIADATIIPPGHERFYSERVVRLPCYQPTDRKRTVSGTIPARHELGLPDGAVVYCCFNGTQKITPSMFGRWMTLLARVPGSVLWLLSCDGATDERLRQQAARRGILPDRLVFAPRRSNEEHLARYPAADLFLDTYPYGAHTTASDALWMGVPVVTLQGNSFASRVCSSLVRAAGLTELVCCDPDGYIERAVQCGQEPGWLAELRHRLKAARDRCTLFDMPLLVARLEELYRQMWEDHLAGHDPVPDLANLDLYNDVGDAIDQEASPHRDLVAYEQYYARALAYRDGISPITPDRRLWRK